MTQNKIVAHYQDGNLFKGITTDFSPNKELFICLRERLRKTTDR